MVQATVHILLEVEENTTPLFAIDIAFKFENGMKYPYGTTIRRRVIPDELFFTYLRHPRTYLRIFGGHIGDNLYINVCICQLHKY